MCRVEPPERLRLAHERDKPLDRSARDGRFGDRHGRTNPDMIPEATLTVKFELTIDDIIETTHPF